MGGMRQRPGHRWSDLLGGIFILPASWKWCQIRVNKPALGIGGQNVVSRVEKQQCSFRKELGVLIYERIRALTGAVLTKRKINQAHPRLRHGLMITTFKALGHVMCSVVCPNPRAHLLDGRIQWIATEIKIGNLDVLAMMPLVQRPGASLELCKKRLIVHDAQGRLTFDMRGGWRQAKLAGRRPLDGRVRGLH